VSSMSSAMRGGHLEGWGGSGDLGGWWCVVSVRVVPEAFGIMAVDPGGKSGAAQGVFLNRGTAKLTLRRAARKGVLRATVVNEEPVRTAVVLAQAWLDFRFKCVVELSIPEPNVYLAVEDFNLRQMAVDLVPVEVAAGLAVLIRNDVYGGPAAIRRPSASEAKTFATAERMKLWNVYDVGRGRGFGDHARDALRHVCLGVNKCLEGKWD
jgi:hypothetical protein